MTEQIHGFNDTIHWYDANAAKYADAIELRYALEEIVQFLSYLPKAAKVLDAGCAAGRDADIMTARGMRVTGIDMSSGLLMEARQRHPDMQVVQGNFLTSSFPNNCFDGVWAHASLLHLETVSDVQQALAEFHRIMKVHGTLYVLVKAQTGPEKTEVVADKLSGHDRFFQYFTQDELTGLLKGAGFEPIYSEKYTEADKSPIGRAEVVWLLALSQKE